MKLDGTRLRQLRREQAWSQRDLARESGVSQDAIARLELGQREAQPRTVRRLAAALGVEPRELMKGNNDA
jgi:transcriptional regulator with XRE-family HTH domain